jgi:hypothetical protein
MIAEYQEKIINDAIFALKKFDPEKFENIDEEKLKQLMALNMLS